MTLEDYIEMRGSEYLTAAEMRALKIDNTKGWRKRNKEEVYSAHTIKCAFQALSKASQHYNRARGDKCLQKLSVIIRDTDWCKEDFEEKHVYLMKNIMGLYKIGISKDPLNRAKTLANSAGVPVYVIKSWKIKGCAPHACESKIHRRFKASRRKGEWFLLSKAQLDYIEPLLREFTEQYELAIDGSKYLDTLSKELITDWLGEEFTC